MLTLLRTVFDQPDTDQVAAQFARVVEALQAKFPAAAQHLAATEGDLLALCGLLARSDGRSGPTTPGATQPGDPPTYRRGRHLPRP